jgi:hypothetical protein
MCLNLVTDLSFKIILFLKPSRPLFTIIITDLISAKESTTNNLVTAKDNIVKHSYFNNKTSNTRYNSENI